MLFLQFQLSQIFCTWSDTVARNQIPNTIATPCWLRKCVQNQNSPFSEHETHTATREFGQGESAKGWSVNKWAVCTLWAVILLICYRHRTAFDIVESQNFHQLCVHMSLAFHTNITVRAWTTSDDGGGAMLTQVLGVKSLFSCFCFARFLWFLSSLVSWFAKTSHTNSVCYLELDLKSAS